MITSDLIDSYQKLIDDGYNPTHLKVTPECIKFLILLHLEDLTCPDDIGKVYNFIIKLKEEKED